MITRIDYASHDGSLRALIERNDSGDSAPWDVLLLDRATDEGAYHVHMLTQAQQIARAWVDHGRRP